LKKLSKK